MTQLQRRFVVREKIKNLVLFGICFIGFAVFIDRFPSASNLENNKDEVNHYRTQYEYLDPNPGKCKIQNFERLRRSAVVYTWVNGSLPCYRDIRKKHGGNNAIGGSRDREIGELKFSIRSWQKYVPWHEGPIYIVTPGHIPEWLKMDHPRIHVINQDDLFPEYAKEFLPSFNTHVIEQFLYRIPGLTDIFIQINDDYIFTKYIPPHAFFTCDGGVKIFQEKSEISHVPPSKDKGIWITSVLNTQQELDLKFGRHKRYYLKHAPFIYSRRAFERIHQIFDRPLYMTLKSKFRAKPDMNIPLLNMYYMVHRGSKELGIPYEVPSQEEVSGYKLILLQDNNMNHVQRIFKEILEGRQTGVVYALNDEYKSTEVADKVRTFFNTFLPERSEFERTLEDPVHPLSIRVPGTCQIDPTILPPQEPRNDSVTLHTIVTYKTVDSVSMKTSFLRGIGLAVGFMMGVNVYMLCSKKFKFEEKSLYHHV